MKDAFSKQAKLYAQFRPTYPSELYNVLLSIVPGKDAAWDCGTGNGQVAGVLADSFKKVHATDISEKQIENAVRKPNISYSIQPAERTSFPDQTFDLIAIAQAIHWFDFKKFYMEVDRTLKRQGIIAVIGYSLPSIDPPTDAILQDFYTNILGTYWDPERTYIDEGYRTIPFPYHEVAAPSLAIEYEWELEHFIGFLNSWSAVQHYLERNRRNPVDLITDRLRKAWQRDLKKKTIFPILLRVGRKE